MNVKNKALALVSLIILILSVFFVAQGIVRYNREIARAIRVEEEIIDGALDDIQKHFFLTYRIRIRHILENNDDIREAFARRDRELLYSLARPLYEDLREENRYFHAWDFNLPDGTVFLRVQNPDLHGDDIGESRAIVSAVHESREQAAGYDVGKHGVIFWIVQPVFHDGEYAGATEFGIPVNQLVEELEEKFHTEVTTIIKASRWNKATLVEQGYRHFGDATLMTHQGSIYAQIPDDFIFNLDRDQRVELGGKSYVLHNCFALRDYGGDGIGNILVLQDISDKIAGRRNFIVASVLVSGILVCVSFAVLYLSFGSLIGRLEKYAEDTRLANEEAEKVRGELEVHVQERTAELRKTYSSLEEQNRFLQTVLESMTHPFYVIDAATYKIVMANKAALAGRDRIEESLTCYRMTHNRDEPCTGEEHPCSLKEVMRTGKPQFLEHIHTDAQGEQRFFEIFAYPVLAENGRVAQVIEYGVDVTERKKVMEEKANLQKQLQQAQKLEAMGTLAGGIAHDFNNILSAIFGYTDLIRYELPEDSSAQPKLQEVLKASERAKDLVRQILTFSRQTEQEKKPLQIHLLIKEAVKLLRASIPATIEIRQDIRDCGLVIADATQIHQVVMNLCTNAFHAMKDGVGVIAVALTTTEVGKDDHKIANLSLLPGRYVKLSVSDTGHGMDRATLDRIFDPYFSTKKKEEGTGLGLAVVHGIVKGHGGHITVYSEPGAGATFNVYLPTIETESSGEEPEAGRVAPAIETLPGGAERILFVDDEEQVAEVGTQMLESLGYRVEAFTSSPEAYEAFSADPARFDLVITDMTMPSMTGTELAQRILALRADIPIVLCTGFSEMINGERAKVLGIREFAMKPLVKAEMARLVRRALNGAVV